VDTDASLEDTARCHHLGRTRAEQWALVSQATRANTTEEAWSEAAVAHQTVDAMFSATDCTSLGVSPGTTPQFVSCETDADCVAYTYPWGGEGLNLPQGYLDAIDVTAAEARWSGNSCQVPMATLREDFCDDCDHAPETRGLICQPSNWAKDARVCGRGERTE
jgi:hypothetical protein